MAGPHYRSRAGEGYFTHVVNDAFTRNEPALSNWHEKLLRHREQVTNTVYDTAYGFSGIAPTLIVAQQHVRNRVSYVTYTDTPGITTAFNHASFYSYDIHGNVDTLLQDYGPSANKPNIMNKNNNRWKKLVYEYDLISGKVNKVKYQPGYTDQFTHRYFYDAENRLTEVETSTDGYTWEKEAKYEYYLHGPLARTTIGQQQSLSRLSGMQGTDYAYTLQSLSRLSGSWLKGMNSTGATATHDIGGDGKVGSLHQYVARDALGFNLNYFHGDYKSINTGVNPFPSYRVPGSGLPDSMYRPLYNGNISSMATNIRKFESLNHVPIFYNYRYDQLNRLVKQDAYFNFNTAANTYNHWNKDVTFHEEVAYDPNGNIQNYLRYAIGPNSKMDDLTYKYYPGTNKLRQVNDVVSAGSYGANPWDLIQDIDNQADTSNYIYDEIGNIIADKAEGITSIKWNVYGKIQEINRTATSLNAHTKIVYSYDAQGNRIGKVTNQGTGKQSYTWYVRDAQGNLMSTYTTESASPVADTSLGNLLLQQADVQVYGSSRLGMLPMGNAVVDNAQNTGPWINPFYSGTIYSRGYRQYELTNHLGNVLTTISDKKLGVSSGGSLTLPGGFTIPSVSYYEPEMLAANDYYPFGMLSRTIGNSDKYKFGFNGKENDNEVKGLGSQQDYGMRVYDPRLGRFLSVDPIQKKYPWFTPYQFAGNSPVAFTDLDGLERNYFVFELNETAQPKLQFMVSQTREPGFWNQVYDATRSQYWNATKSYRRKTEYNGDLITDCSDIYVLQQGMLFREFSSYADMKKATTDDVNEAQAKISEDITNKVWYGEMSLAFHTAPTDFYGAAGGSEYADLYSDNPFSEHVPESNIRFPRAISTGKGGLELYAPAKFAVSGKPELVGLGELKANVLKIGIYMKDGNTGAYLLKKGTMTGAEVFRELYNKAISTGGVIKTIQANWNPTSDNLKVFNKLISEGVSPSKAATQTFTGIQAGLQGYKSATVDYEQSKVNADGTFEKAVINFNK